MFGPGVDPAAVARSAFRAGSLVRFLSRSSAQAPTGAVVICSFTCRARACAFARRWAIRTGATVAVRSGCILGQWDVGVPVRREGSRVGGWAIPVTGGLRGFRRALQSSGFAGWRRARPAARTHG